MYTINSGNLSNTPHFIAMKCPTSYVGYGNSLRVNRIIKVTAFELSRTVRYALKLSATSEQLNNQ